MALVGAVPDTRPLDTYGIVRLARNAICGRPRISQAIRNEPIVAPDHYGAGYCGMTRYGTFDVAKLDAESPELDLFVFSAQHSQHAGLLETGNVARPVE